MNVEEETEEENEERFVCNKGRGKSMTKGYLKSFGSLTIALA